MKIKLGIQVARTILTGDLDLARKIAGERRTWEVAEIRAIIGACQEMNRRFAGLTALFGVGEVADWKSFL